MPTAEFESLAAHLELVRLPHGQMLYEPGGQLQHAYFPTTAIVSLHYITESGASAETAGVGNEGVLGVSLFMGGDTTSSSAVAQTAGQAYRLERRRLKQEFDRAGRLQRAGFIGYRRAHIAVLDRRGLESSTCECYAVVRKELNRLLSDVLYRQGAAGVASTAAAS